MDLEEDWILGKQGAPPTRSCQCPRSHWQVPLTRQNRIHSSSLDGRWCWWESRLLSCWEKFVTPSTAVIRLAEPGRDLGRPHTRTSGGAQPETLVQPDSGEQVDVRPGMGRARSSAKSLVRLLGDQWRCCLQPTCATSCSERTRGVQLSRTAVLVH
jgi:hypothetical protein